MIVVFRPCFFLLFFFGIAGGFFSCRHSNGGNSFECRGGVVRLETYSDSFSVLRFYLADSVMSEWRLRYPVYRFDYGDVNSDGVPEVAVGVIKPTRFFPTPQKRLFLIRINRYCQFRPLWLGSRLGDELVDFRIVRDSFPARIVTTNISSSGCLSSSQFILGAFGPDFEHYIDLSK